MIVFERKTEALASKILCVPQETSNSDQRFKIPFLQPNFKGTKYLSFKSKLGGLKFSFGSYSKDYSKVSITNIIPDKDPKFL